MGLIDWLNEGERKLTLDCSAFRYFPHTSTESPL